MHGIRTRYTGLARDTLFAGLVACAVLAIAGSLAWLALRPGPPPASLLADRPGAGPPKRVNGQDVVDSCAVLPISELSAAGLRLADGGAGREYIDHDVTGLPAGAGTTACNYGTLNDDWPDSNGTMQVFFRQNAGVPHSASTSYEVMPAGIDLWRAVIRAPEGDIELRAENVTESSEDDAEGRLLHRIAERVTERVRTGDHLHPPQVWSYTDPYADAGDVCSAIPREAQETATGSPSSGTVFVASETSDEDHIRTRHHMWQTCTRHATDPRASVTVRLIHYRTAEAAAEHDRACANAALPATFADGPACITHPISLPTTTVQPVVVYIPAQQPLPPDFPGQPPLRHALHFRVGKVVVEAFAPAGVDTPTDAHDRLLPAARLIEEQLR